MKAGVRATWCRLLAAHVVLVLGLTLLFVILDVTYRGIGANIGLGIAGLPLLALGLPWSLLAVRDAYFVDGLPYAAWYLFALGPAFLNVVLHLVVFGAARRWDRRP